jgi:hypothetical protein
MATVLHGTYAQAACALNSLVHYTMGTTTNLMTDLRIALERMCDTNTAAIALQQAEFFRQKHGDFAGELAVRLAVDRGTSLASWWSMFGSQTPTLQRIAMKLLSQCASSSGCERNWSSFGFIHTKLHNKLGHNKLHKLVFVNYNLRLRIQCAGSIVEPSNFDPVSRMMDLSFYYCRNAIED